MSHYEIDYAALTGDAKRDQAIADIKQYLGEERFEKITESLIPAVIEGADIEEFRFPLAFAGVRGYPVTAWIEHIQKLIRERAS